MVWPVVSVLTMLDAPSLVATAQGIERCPLFSAGRSFGNAGKDGTSAVDVVLDPSRRVDDFRGEEHRIDRFSIGSLSVPAVQRHDLLDSTMVNGR
jgi:hypothetical protein